MSKVCYMKSGGYNRAVPDVLEKVKEAPERLQVGGARAVLLLTEPDNQVKLQNSS